MIVTLLSLALALPAQQVTDAQLAAWIADDLCRDTRGSSTTAEARLQGAGYVDDMRLARQVSAKLAGAGAHGVIVGVHEGEVKLHGHVADDAHRQKAVELAAAIEGVRGVENGLLLPDEKPAVQPDRSEDAAPAPVLPADFGPVSFLTADGLAGHGIVVHVDEGVATLSGEASSQGASRYATVAALRVPGVRAVRNELAVRRADISEDRRLALMVQRELENDVVVQVVANALMVSVKDGVATVSGKVRDEGQHAQAVAVVAAQSAVFAVEDRIVVDENLLLPSHGRIPGFRQFRDR
jgi:hyperosmotically inducible protein